jgi:type IV/VI secretion system ImpK/VasF family protein
MMNCQFWPEISTCLNDVEKEKLSLTKKAINLDAITAARENMNRHIEQLRLSLDQGLDKKYASHILFALVAYFDEEIQRHLSEKGQGNWVPLQKDFYGAYNAGNLYYETIDKIIEDTQAPEIVFRVFYFILKKGFLGKYRDSKTHITKYLDILREKISIETPAHQPKDPKAYLQHMKSKVKRWHYYAGAGAVSLVLFIMLYLTTSAL